MQLGIRRMNNYFRGVLIPECNIRWLENWKNIIFSYLRHIQQPQHQWENHCAIAMDIACPEVFIGSVIKYEPKGIPWDLEKLKSYMIPAQCKEYCEELKWTRFEGYPPWPREFDGWKHFSPCRRRVWMQMTPLQFWWKVHALHSHF